MVVTCVSVGVFVLSQGVGFLNSIYPEGGFSGSARREELFALIPKKGVDVRSALKASITPCVRAQTDRDFLPVSVKMFTEVVVGITRTKSAQAGKYPTDAEIDEHRSQNVMRLASSYGSEVESLNPLKRKQLKSDTNVLREHGAKIINCLFDKAHASLVGKAKA
jgi:hypothetical protein